MNWAYILGQLLGCTPAVICLWMLKKGYSARTSLLTLVGGWVILLTVIEMIVVSHSGGN